jgi:hypothetical protein
MERNHRVACIGCAETNHLRTRCQSSRRKFHRLFLTAIPGRFRPERPAASASISRCSPDRVGAVLRRRESRHRRGGAGCASVAAEARRAATGDDRRWRPPILRDRAPRPGNKAFARPRPAAIEGGGTPMPACAGPAVGSVGDIGAAIAAVAARPARRSGRRRIGAREPTPLRPSTRPGGSPSAPPGLQPPLRLPAVRPATRAGNARAIAPVADPRRASAPADRRLRGRSAIAGSVAAGRRPRAARTRSAHGVDAAHRDEATGALPAGSSGTGSPEQMDRPAAPGSASVRRAADRAARTGCGAKPAAGAPAARRGPGRPADAGACRISRRRFRSARRRRPDRACLPVRPGRWA